jgi:hypothetical protein
MKQTVLLIAAITSITASLVMGPAACAPAPDRDSLSHRSPRADASPHADAVLPSGRNLFVFDFSQSRYQKWTLSAGPADSLGVCRVLDTLAGNWADRSHWLALPSPSQPFAPMLAFWGPNGNFFLLDRVGKRLGMYDTSAQFLSSFPLPPEIRDRNLDRFEVFWTRDGQFSFLDLGEGMVWQFAELRTAGGQGEWRLRNTVRLPMGLEACLWEPYLRDPCCLQAGASVCFDPYFNPLKGGPKGPGPRGLLPRASSSSPGWNLILDGGPACASRPPACFLADKAEFSTCPSEADAAPPR